jgi:hypothetical protein
MRQSYPLQYSPVAPSGSSLFSMTSKTSGKWQIWAVEQAA